MAELSYTKGEWKFNRPIIETDNTKICVMEEPHYMPDCGDATWYNGCVENMEANAHLIAAAPDLYEACKALIEAVDEDYDIIGYGREMTIREALAKAEGKDV